MINKSKFGFGDDFDEQCAIFHVIVNELINGQ